MPTMKVPTLDPWDVQDHPLDNGTYVKVGRQIKTAGNVTYHIYKTDTTPELPSVTKVLAPTGPGFSVGMGWAIKEIREAGGDLKAPQNSTDQAVAEGSAIHDAISRYIDHTSMTENNPAFIGWFHSIGNHPGRIWVASERYIFSQTHEFGGTLDAISMEENGEYTLWDWKTKDKDKYYKNLKRYGPDTKDFCQASAYCAALYEMGSKFAPSHAKIVYIFRDGTGCHEVDVDLKKYTPIFHASRELQEMMDRATLEAKHKAKMESEAKV